MCGCLYVTLLKGVIKIGITYLKTTYRKTCAQYADIISGHCSKAGDWPMMSRPKDVLNDFFVYYQDHSEYIGLSNIEQGFHGEPALKKHYKTSIWISTSSSAITKHFIRKCILSTKIYMLPSSFKQHLGKLCSIDRDWAMTVTMQGYILQI